MSIDRQCELYIWELNQRESLGLSDMEMIRKAWIASRAALVVELPNEFGAMTHPCADKELVMDAQEVREAIESTGVRTK